MPSVYFLKRLYSETKQIAPNVRKVFFNIIQLFSGKGEKNNLWQICLPSPESFSILLIYGDDNYVLICKISVLVWGKFDRLNHFLFYLIPSDWNEK